MMLSKITIMVEHEINIYIEQTLVIPQKKEWFVNLINNILIVLDIESPIELGLVVTDSKTIHQLNKTYRNKDKPTDVLAFPMLDGLGQSTVSTFVAPPDGIRHLGEIIISYHEAVIQAKEFQHEVVQEIAALIIHGVLHLIGYDHNQSEERLYMRAKEEEVMKKMTYSKE